MSTANRWTPFGDIGGAQSCSSFHSQICTEMSMIHTFSTAQQCWKCGDFSKGSCLQKLSFFSTALIIIALKEALFGIRTVNILMCSQFYFIQCPILSTGWNAWIKYLQWANSTRQPLSCSLPSKLLPQRLFLCILNSENIPIAPFWGCLDFGGTRLFFL